MEYYNNFNINLLQRASRWSSSFICPGVQLARSVNGRGSSMYHMVLSSPYASRVNVHIIGPLFGAITPWQLQRSSDGIAHCIRLTEEFHLGTNLQTYASTVKNATNEQHEDGSTLVIGLTQYVFEYRNMKHNLEHHWVGLY